MLSGCANNGEIKYKKVKVKEGFMEETFDSLCSLAFTITSLVGFCVFRPLIERPILYKRGPQLFSSLWGVH